MRKIGMKRLVVVLTLLVCIGVPLLVNALTCTKCGHAGATLFSKEEVEWTSNNHYHYMKYYMKCPDCGTFYRFKVWISDGKHDLKTTIKNYPKSNVRVITKTCKDSGCGYKKVSYERIDPKKPYVLPK